VTWPGVDFSVGTAARSFGTLVTATDAPQPAPKSGPRTSATRKPAAAQVERRAWDIA
jgi:hypothetical protein